MMRCVFAILCLAACLANGGEFRTFPTWSEPRAVTQGPHEHFLASYFAIDSWSPNKRYMLVLETDVNGRLPEANERCTLGVVDLEDGNRFIPVATIACWNFQEAAMAFWMDDETILFNDVRDGKFKTVIMNWRTGKDVRILPRPVSAVSEDRTWAVSVNYARLSLLRPDYGYAGPGQDPQETVAWPENDGLWTMDLNTGESKLILSVADTRSQMPQPKRVEGKPGQPLAYHCHTVISKDGEKIFFLARSVDWFDKVTHKIPYWRTTSFTVDRDGGNLRRCFKDNWEGSHFNWAPDGSHKMLVTVTCNDAYDPKVTGRAWSPVVFEVGKESEVRRIGTGILDLDWHCIYSPDGKFMSGETYWNQYFERPWVLVRLEDGATMPMGSFYVPEKYRGTYWRCDLHARYRPDGKQIAFNSVHEGSRQVYVRDIRLPGEPMSLNDGWTADGVPVTLPHCWNVEDGTDGPTDLKCWNHDSVAGTGYVRRKVVYRRELPPSEKTRWLRINAASIHAVVRVDGREVGRHAGAFTAFTVEVPRGGKGVEIEVDNFYDPDVPPVCGDFTMYGGLYRGVDLLDEPETFSAPTDLPKYEFREDGFSVDGAKTFLKGICYHQDREGKGWAISAEDEEEDIKLIKAMGANAIRTSHYPRSERFYDLCDKYGLYVWTEIPLVDATTASETFRSNTLNVAREMVLQHRHHKCIAMWGIFNELYLKKMPEGQAEPLVREVKALIRSLDPRPIVAASNNPKKKELNAIPDALGFNMYPGWYGGESMDLGREIEEWRTANGRSCVAISEYGAGGSLGQPMPSPDYRPQPGGKCHPVDYQLKHHQASWAAIKTNPNVWGCFVWVMFDAGSDNRHEGARNGLNDKGLVGFDHKTLKPAYRFYQSTWAK